MYNARTSQRPPRRLPTKRLLVWLGVGMAALILLAVLLEMTGVTDFINSRRAKEYVTTPATSDRTVNENTKGETAADKDTTPQYRDDKSEQTIIDDNTTLAVPAGSFVSNHSPNLSGSPAPNELQSTCTTTPGATCQIIFKNGSTTKMLPVQQTDRGGSAYWTWKLQDIDLTEGSWEVTAKSVLGSQTKTASDSMKLEVKK